MELYIRRGKEITKEDFELKVGRVYNIIEYFGKRGDPISVDEIVKGKEAREKVKTLVYEGTSKNSNGDLLVKFGELEINPEYFVINL